MKAKLFFPGIQDIGNRILASSHALLALDYDGTLTSIVDDPAQALLAPPVRQVLAELARRSDVAVAIVSGRALVDLQELVGILDLIYAGNHGMEISGPSMRFIEPGAQASAQAFGELAVELANKLRHISGAFVEDKGLTLSIHYRRVAAVDAEEVSHTVRRAVEPVKDRFHVTTGSKVYEVRPLVPWNKGAAVTWIMERLEIPDALVIYIGDDATDKDAFAALRGNAVTIKVGDTAAATTAHYRLPSPADVYDFLRWTNDVLQMKVSNAATR
jgi:trehalose 6-phosphate phosphatase